MNQVLDQPYSKGEFYFEEPNNRSMQVLGSEPMQVSADLIPKHTGSRQNFRYSNVAGE